VKWRDLKLLCVTKTRKNDESSNGGDFVAAYVSLFCWAVMVVLVIGACITDDDEISYLEFKVAFFAGIASAIFLTIYLCLLA
jgi:hypothetical protein